MLDAVANNTMHDILSFPEKDNLGSTSKGRRNTSQGQEGEVKSVIEAILVCAYALHSALDFL
jgi:hypothetical protein